MLLLYEPHWRKVCLVLFRKYWIQTNKLVLFLLILVIVLQLNIICFIDINIGMDFRLHNLKVQFVRQFIYTETHSQTSLHIGPLKYCFPCTWISLSHEFVFKLCLCDNLTLVISYYLPAFIQAHRPCLGWFAFVWWMLGPNMLKNELSIVLQGHLHVIIRIFLDLIDSSVCDT